MSAEIIPFLPRSAAPASQERSFADRWDRLAVLAKRGAFRRTIDTPVPLARGTQAVLEEVRRAFPGGDPSNLTLQMCRLIAELRDMHCTGPTNPPRPRKKRLSVIEGGAA